MPFLAINGVEIEVANGTFQEQIEEIGETTRAYDGSLRKSRQTVKRNIAFQTPPMISSEALAWDGLIRGLGHKWAFDTSTYSSKGLSYSAQSGTTVTAGNAKHGAGRLNIDPTTGTITFDTNLGSAWTVLFFWSSDNGSTYTHYIVNSAGNKWVDGVRNDAAATTMLSVSSGDVTLANTAGGDRELDDLVALPFSIPTGWGSSLYTFHNSNAWPLLPKLSLSGDIVHEATTRTAMGSVGQSSAIKVVLSGSMQTNARILSIELNEA